MELRLLKGPIDDSWLEPVVELYGAHRAKYRDLAFCRRLFNGNPSGFSYHAFLLQDGSRVVGHYSIIPTDILVDGRRRRGGKAEALIVHPEHRAATVLLGEGTPVLCGLAMPASLYRFALDDGLEVVHMIPDPGVQAIYPITGARPVPARHRRARLFVRPAAAAGGATAGRRALQRTLAVGQRIAFELAGAASLAGLGRVEREPARDLDAERLAGLVAGAPEARGWTVALDGPMLAWLAQAGAAEVLHLDGGWENYAVVSPTAGEGRVMEILFWRQRTGGLRSALRLLAAVVRSAGRAGDQVVGVPLHASWEAEERTRLHAAAHALAFQERTQDTNLFVSTRDRYYLDPANVYFTPLFYGIF